jgi:hypothetical protein
LFRPGFRWNKRAAFLAISFICLAWIAHLPVETSSAPSWAASSPIAATENSNFECLGPHPAVSRNTVPIQLFADHSAGEALSLTVSRIKRTLTIDVVSAGMCELPHVNGVSLFSGPTTRHGTIDSGPLVARKIRLQV